MWKCSFGNYFSRRFCMIKARLLQSLVFSRQTRSDEIFVQFVQLNEYLGNASKLSQRFPPFNFFGALIFRFFFVLKVSPLRVYWRTPRNIRGKRYIRTFEVTSELYCGFVRRRRKS